MVKRMMPKRWYSLRYEVLERDHFQCQTCGQYAPNVQLQVDHIIADADGGTDDIGNLQTMCFACNQGKSGLWMRRNHQARVNVGGHHKSRVPTLADLIEERVKEPMTAMAIARLCGIPSTSVRNTLRRMAKQGRIQQDGRAWVPSMLSSVDVQW